MANDDLNHNLSMDEVKEWITLLAQANLLKEILGPDGAIIPSFEAISIIEKSNLDRPDAAKLQLAQAVTIIKFMQKHRALLN